MSGQVLNASLVGSRVLAASSESGNQPVELHILESDGEGEYFHVYIRDADEKQWFLGKSWQVVKVLSTPGASGAENAGEKAQGNTAEENTQGSDGTQKAGKELGKFFGMFARQAEKGFRDFSEAMEKGFDKGKQGEDEIMVDEVTFEEVMHTMKHLLHLKYEDMPHAYLMRLPAEVATDPMRRAISKAVLEILRDQWENLPTKKFKKGDDGRWYAQD